MEKYEDLMKCDLKKYDEAIKDEKGTEKPDSFKIAQLRQAKLMKSIEINGMFPKNMGFVRGIPY